MGKVLPILFNTDMVKAILENRKTVTRRLIKQEIKSNQRINLNGKRQFELYNTSPKYGIPQGIIFKPPYQQGDILYVRETWQFMPCIECNKCENCKKESDTYSDKESISEGCFIYRADYPQPERINWNPSIHMPKAAARIWLEVIDVRVEQLQDMRLNDFLNEGISIPYEAFNDPENARMQSKKLFIHIWDSTIKKEQHDLYGWNGNPWVWAIEFLQCKRPESEGLQ